MTSRRGRPLIVYDPRPEADATRGTVPTELVEYIDLAPTFLEFFGGENKPEVLEGRSLLPLLAGKETSWREYAISEYDYATREPRLTLGIDQANARLIMIRDKRYKYIHCEGYRPILFDLEGDPDELNDLGADPAHEDVRVRMHEALFDWARLHHSRTTMSAERIDRMAGREPPGIVIGVWDEADYERTFGKPMKD